MVTCPGPLPLPRSAPALCQEQEGCLPSPAPQDSQFSCKGLDVENGHRILEKNSLQPYTCGLRFISLKGIHTVRFISSENTIALQGEREKPSQRQAEGGVSGAGDAGWGHPS